VGELYDAALLGTDFVEPLCADKVV